MDSDDAIDRREHFAFSVRVILSYAQDLGAVLYGL